MKAAKEDDWDWECAAWLVGETDLYRVHVIPMIFNHRLVMTPKNSLGGYDIGWCYPDLVSALNAAREWDPVADWTPASSSRPRDFMKEVP